MDKSLTNKELNSSNLQGLLDDMQTMVGIFECDGTIIFVNNTPLIAGGLKLIDVVGKKLWECPWFNYDAKTQNIVKNDITRAHAGENILRDIQVSMAEGLMWIEFSLHPVFDEQGAVIQVVGEGRNVSLRKAAEEKALYQAHFDSLTNLPNRFLILDRLTQLLNKAQRDTGKVVVMFLDLDDFKKINDALGHGAGDKLLVQAAERLHKAVRVGDTVGRLGGDEFILILSRLSSACEAGPIAENILNLFRKAFKIDGRELMLTASLGIAVFPEDGNNTSELLRNADSAMYHSKEMGRNTYSYFTQTMNTEVSRRLALDEQLHGALDRNEFKVFYQPIIEVSSGKVSGTEALLRWINPVLGEVSPEEFIPIAEQNGLILPIGKFVISEALAMCAHLHQQIDAGFNMAINISPCQFLDPKLFSYIQKSLKQSGVPEENLELEITEGVLIGSHGDIEDVINKLHRMGVKIVMDDFGTGYSSLNYLRKYPFDSLKIDRSFVCDISEDKANRELISTAISMAHNLNLKVVAEGVETKEQLAFLTKLSCDYAQGFYFSKAIEAEEITKFLKSSKYK